jgi:hypothetical protein
VTEKLAYTPVPSLRKNQAGEGLFLAGKRKRIRVRRGLERVDAWVTLLVSSSGKSPVTLCQLSLSLSFVKSLLPVTSCQLSLYKGKFEFKVLKKTEEKEKKKKRKNQRRLLRQQQ